MGIETIKWSLVASAIWFGIYQVITIVNGAPCFSLPQIDPDNHPHQGGFFIPGRLRYSSTPQPGPDGCRENLDACRPDRHAAGTTN